MKKGFWLMSAILAMMMAFILPVTSANAAASFKVSDLTISPTFVTAGSGDGTVTISVKVANTGTEAGTYKAELKINDATETTKDVTLKPGENQTVIFPITKTEVGEYTVSIGDLKSAFSVAPAGLEVKNLLIDPLEVNPDKPVVISVTAQNKLTDKPLTYDSLKLFINGTVVDKKRIDLKAGESATVSFTVTKKDVGNYVVQIGSKTGTFAVKASFFNSMEWWMWGIGIIVLIIIIMVVMILAAPKKKKQVVSRTGKPIKGPPLGGPVQPTVVQPPFGQQMPPSPFGSEQMPPYPGQIPQPPPTAPPYPNQPQQMPPRTMPPFPGPTQQMPPQQPVSPQQASPYHSQQQPPYPGQMPQPPTAPLYPSQPQQIPPQAMPPLPAQRQQMPPRTMPPFPGPAQQMPPQQPFTLPQMPSMKPEQFGAQPPFVPGIQPGFGQPSFGMTGRHVPQFTISNLTITPQQVKEGDPINISAVVTNNSTATAQYSMVLRIGGVVENISEMTLNPGANQTALFTVMKDVPGDYYVEVDGQRGIFTVIRRLPAAFSVTNLTIAPERVKQGEPITISAIVTNTGETTGSYSVVLRIKGIAESIEEVELGPGRSQKVVFTITKDTAGFYPVALENLSGRFVVEMDWKG